MNGIKYVLRATALIGVAAVSAAFGVDNPLETSLDGAMVRHNGRYYGMSAETNGQMLVSDNLLDWHSPISVASDEVSGPYELIARNGLFYLYSGRVGGAVSVQPDQPFSSMKKAGLAGDQMRMSLMSDGTLFSVNRVEGRNKDGEIVLQRYGNPWTLFGKPKRLLDGRKGLWDSIDSSNLSEPEILNYRGQYYLLYAANHPGPRTGLREIGVAMNENPYKFENNDKRSNPVLLRNAERLARSYKPILPSGEFGPWSARYTTQEPSNNWTSPHYRYVKWRSGKGGFGSPDNLDGATLHACRTKWEDDRIWIRREFDLYNGDLKTPVLNIRHEGAVQVFINGKKVYESVTPSPAYSNFDLSEECMGLFKQEDNVVAVRAVAMKNAQVQYIDFGLYDAGGAAVESTVYGLNAPRIITGPNGFEKWMTYQAWWNGEFGTGLDRVFFFDKELVVDGPTTTNTPGYHPAPAMPTFSDGFTDTSESGLTNRWTIASGDWQQTNGVVRQADAKVQAKAYLDIKPAAHYLFETDIRFPASGKADVGVVAWSNGKQDFMVRINPAKKIWSYAVSPGSLAPKRFKLPKSFKLMEAPSGFKGGTNAPLHRLKITKNGGYFEVYLNGVNLLPNRPIITQLHGRGVPGLYCNGAAAEFDNVVYTVGWDEYNEYITGWGLGHDSTSFGGEWSLEKEDGLYQRRHSDVGRAFKGDLLDQYEFCVNVKLRELRDTEDKNYGIFPVFADKNNYVKAMIDARARELVVTGKLDGLDIKPVRASLRTEVERNFLYDKNTPHRDIISWIYKLRSQSVISGFDVLWFEGESEHLENEFFVPADDMDIRYAKVKPGREIIPTNYIWEESEFVEADVPKPKGQVGGVFNRIAMREEKADYLGFGIYTEGGAYVYNTVTGKSRDYIPGEDLGPNEELANSGYLESDTPSRPLKTIISLELESSYFFRCVKLENKVIVELNGRPMAELPGTWPPAQVGLITEGQPAFYNGISLHHIPEVVAPAPVVQDVPEKVVYDRDFMDE